MNSFSRRFFLLLVIGFILRIAIMFWSFNFRENTDVLRWRDWGRIAYLYSLTDTYKPDHLSFGTLPNNMPPGTLYVATSMYQVNIQVSKIILKITHAEEGSLQWVNGILLNAFLRIPSIAADLVIALLIYIVVKKRASENRALFASLLFIFNPVILYNSSFWGQMDSINNVFFYASLFFVYKKAHFRTILFFLLSLYIKLSLIFFFPALLVLLFKNVGSRYKELLISGISSVGVIFLLTLPISKTPYIWLFEFLKKNSIGEMQNITTFAFNAWWLMLKPHISIGTQKDLFNFSEIRLIDSPLSTSYLFGFPLSFLAIFAFVVFLLPILFRLIKMNKEKILLPEFTTLLFGIIALLGFLLLPQMHERYMYPLFPLLATYIGIKKKYLLIYLLLSLLNFINIYIVWHPFMSPLMPYTLMNNRDFQWMISFCTVMISGIFYLIYVKSLYAEKTK